MQPSRITTFVGLAAAALLMAPAAFGETARYDAAHVDYEIGHYEQAFAAFAGLADEGHCDAVRIAQQMMRYGPALYAIRFDAAPERMQRWQRLAACSATLAGAGTAGRAR